MVSHRGVQNSEDLTLEKILYGILKSFDFIEIIVILCDLSDFVKYINTF